MCRFQRGDHRRESSASSLQALYGFAAAPRQTHLRRGPGPPTVGADRRPLPLSVSPRPVAPTVLRRREQSSPLPEGSHPPLASVGTDPRSAFTLAHMRVFCPGLSFLGELVDLPHQATRQLQALRVMPGNTATETVGSAVSGPDQVGHPARTRQPRLQVSTTRFTSGEPPQKHLLCGALRIT